MLNYHTLLLFISNLLFVLWSFALFVAELSDLVFTFCRGSLKSPWSRRRRKHALLSKQWKSFFLPDGTLCDGGVKFLKKVRSGVSTQLFRSIIILNPDAIFKIL